MIASKKLKKRELILRAARECFARFGFDKTTLDEIGQKTNLNKASLYYYFKNKEELFIQVILSETAIYIQHLQKSTQKQTSSEDKIIHYLTKRLHAYPEVMNVHQLFILSLQKIGAPFDQLYAFIKDKELSLIQDILEQAQAEGEIRTDQKLPQLAENIFTIGAIFKQNALRHTLLLPANELDNKAAEEGITALIQLVFKGMRRK